MKHNTIDRESQVESEKKMFPPKKVADLIDWQTQEQGQDDYDPIEYQHHYEGKRKK